MQHSHQRTPEEHLDAVRAHLPRREIVDLPLSEALGLPLARDVSAVEDSPRFDNSQMDGYAVGEEHLAGGKFAVGPVVAAGADPAHIVPRALSAVVPVMTGAKIPVGTVAIVPVEWCQPGEFGADFVTIPPTPAGQFIRSQGSDITAGVRIVRAGHVINASLVGAAAAQGLSHLPVHEPARVLICTGGDEVGNGTAAPDGAATIRDANGPMLEALCAHHGIEVAGHVRTSDDPVAFGAVLTAAVERTAPTAVITSGGISHGRFEVVRQFFEGLQMSGASPREMGKGQDDKGSDIAPWFGHVAQQPGGPQGLATVAGVPVVALPGNPISTLVSFRLFVAPVLGIAAAPMSAILNASVSGIEGMKNKDCFHRGQCRTVEGQVKVTVVGGAGSHLLAQSVGADCLVRIPANSTSCDGDVVTIYPL